MLDNDAKAALRAILRSDDRPWPTVLDGKNQYVADLHFRPSDLGKMHALASAARELGFEVIEGEKLALNESFAAEVAKYGTLFITGAGLLKGLVNVIEIPANLRKLRDKLRPYFPNSAELAPSLQLEPVHRWLDSKYGDRWSYEPSKLAAKTIARVTVFLVKEKVSGNVHLLAVEGDTVEELPVDWLRDY